MENLAPDSRNAVRAVILRNSKVLLLKKTGGARGERYALPGGAQETGETLPQALFRECLEEIGARVEIGPLIHVADTFKKRDTDPPGIRHVIEFLFLCRVADDYEARNGSKPDRSQVGVVWVAQSELASLPMFPGSLSHWLPLSLDAGAKVYLGVLQ
jgi:ADP-ribose pyrophosphatase YjhB (NUDIX family)